MLIHSSRLTDYDIRDSVPDRCYLAGHYNRHGDWASIHEAGSRSHERSFSVRLAGSSPYNMQRLPDKSATWDEWGNFIAELFQRDPSAKIGQYDGVQDFIDQTSSEYERMTKHMPERGIRAPWLKWLPNYIKQRGALV